MVREGLHVYIGTTGTGKTHKAIRDAAALAASVGRGLLVIDSRGAENLREIQPEYRAGMALYRQLWEARQVCRIVPNTPEEFNTLIQEVDKRGNVVILVDEVATWASNPTLQQLVRVWRHRRVSLFLTTQKVGRDVEQGILACDPVLYVFRTTAPATLEWLERWHRIPPERFRALQVGQHFELTL